MSEENKKCDSCRWYDAQQCKRNAPVGIKDSFGLESGVWPPVNSWDCCGQHEPRVQRDVKRTDGPKKPERPAGQIITEGCTGGR